jgi:hypothetical protein
MNVQSTLEMPAFSIRAVERPRQGKGVGLTLHPLSEIPLEHATFARRAVSYPGLRSLRLKHSETKGKHLYVVVRGASVAELKAARLLLPPAAVLYIAREALADGPWGPGTAPARAAEDGFAKGAPTGVLNMPGLSERDSGEPSPTERAGLWRVSFPREVPLLPGAPLFDQDGIPLRCLGPIEPDCHPDADEPEDEEEKPGVARPAPARAGPALPGVAASKMREPGRVSFARSMRPGLGGSGIARLYLTELGFFGRLPFFEGTGNEEQRADEAEQEQEAVRHQEQDLSATESDTVELPHWVLSARLADELGRSLLRWSATPEGLPVREAAAALRLPEGLVEEFGDRLSAQGRLCRSGGYVLPPHREREDALSPAARSLLKRIDAAGKGGIRMRELGDRSTEKLVRGMQRMGFCRILSNGLVLGQAAVSQLVLDLHAAGSAELHLRDVARILSLSRNSTRALVDALAEDGSVEKISETVVRVPDEA